MTKMMSVEEICQIALQLKAEGVEPNCAQIARRVGRRRIHISHLVHTKYAGFGLETVVVKNQRYALAKHRNLQTLRQAARVIDETGRIVSIATLVEVTKWKRKRVWFYIDRYPHLVEELDLHPDSASALWDAAHRIVVRDEGVTRIALVQESRLSYRTIFNILKQYPDWKDELGIHDSSWGSGVARKLRTATN